MVFLVNLSRIVFAPMVQPVAADFGVTAASLGVVTSAAWLGSASPRIPTGYLLTRFPRHRVVAGTGSLLVMTAVFTATAGSVAHLAVGAYLMGLSSGIYFIAANPLVSELFPTGIGRALGLHGMSSQLAAVLAPLALSGILLVGPWRLTFIAIAGAAALITISFWWAARRTPLPTAGEADRSLLEAGRAQWPLILTGIVIMGSAGFLWNGLFNLYGDYLDVAKGIEPGTGRVLLSIMFAAGVPGFFLSGRLADRLPRVPYLLSLVATFSIAVVALTVVEGLVAITVVSLVIGYTLHSTIPAMDTYLLATLPNRHRGSAYALYSATMMVTLAMGSGVVGTAVTYGITYTAAYRFIAVVLGGVIVVLGVLFRLGRLPAGRRPGRPAIAEEPPSV